MIPAEVNLMIDLRHVDDTRLDELEAMLYRRLDAAARRPVYRSTSSGVGGPR